MHCCYVHPKKQKKNRDDVKKQTANDIGYKLGSCGDALIVNALAAGGSLFPVTAAP